MTGKILLGLLLTLIIGRFVVVGMPKILRNHISSDGDESAYLALGLAVIEEGKLNDGTRPPLYPLLLTPFAERSWSYFTSAKFVSLGLGILTILAVFWIGVYIFGWQTALVAVFMLAANKEFHLRATTVYADVLLALVLVGAWYFLIKSLEGWRYCLLAGFFVGLSFLTKGSAPVLLVAWGLMALLHYRLAVFRHFELLLVPLIFVITSLPLFIYNANQFGNPTYNFATQHIMWMDKLEQINTANTADMPTFSTYMASHSTADITARIRKGLRRLNPVIARTVIPGRSFDPAWLGQAIAVLAVGTFIFLLVYRRQEVGDYLDRHKNTLWFSFFLYGIFYVFFVWYVAGSSAETRFVMPLLAPLYLLLADVVVTLFRGLWGWLEAQKYKRGLTAYRLAYLLVVAWGVLWLLNSSYAEVWALNINPYQSDRSANAEVEEFVQWLVADSPGGELMVTFGPSKSLPLWKFPARFSFERLPVDINSWPKMKLYVDNKQPDYIIIDDDTARRRRQALAGYFKREGDGLVMFEQIPAGWNLDFLYAGLPCKWCVFSPTVADTNNTPLAVLEGGFTLFDYNIAGATQADSTIYYLSAQADKRSMRVILTWQAQETISDDYILFVHLTAPDGFVKAQSDIQPFNAALPTSSWRAGENMAIRFDLPLNDSITPGDYLLLAGMYNPADGQRLAVSVGQPAPVPDMILLGAVQIRGED